MSLQLRVGTNDQIDQIFGSLTDGTWTATLSGDRARFNARTNPAPCAGSYTLLLPGSDADPARAAGNGFATVSVNRNGLVLTRGTLGDGTHFTQSAQLSTPARWPFYVPLYSNLGSVLSWLAFTNRPADDLNGVLNWIKLPNARARYYPEGFATETFAIGSLYLPPVSATNHILNLVDAQLTFSGGNLNAPFTNLIELGNGSRVTNLSGNRLRLRFSLATGTFAGRVADPVNGMFYPFTGAVLQKLNSGFGVLLGTNQTSRLTLSP